MKIHFFSFNKNLGNIGKLTVQDIYRSLGNNSGNLMFIEALSRQIDASNITYGYNNFTADDINSNYDAVVIPAANWLCAEMNLTGFSNALAGIKKPCILIGVGAQSSDFGTIPNLPPATLRFLDLVSTNSVTIGVRGHFSKQVLDHYGYTNSVVIGCPSLYFSCMPTCKTPIINDSIDGSDIIVQGTRHNLPNAHFYLNGSNAEHRKMFLYGLRNDYHYIIQSELEEIYYALRRFGNPSLHAEILGRLLSYYDVKDRGELEQYLLSKYHFFVNVEEWFGFLSKKKLLVTSRIHGSIAALHAGTPALLLDHDTRTTELADFAGIPRMPYSQFNWQESAQQAVAKINYTEFDQKYRANYAVYKAFLDSNGLAHKLDAETQVIGVS